MSALVPHPTRRGWLCDEHGVCFEDTARPAIQWKHVDGPLLRMRNGEMHWLTFCEHLRCCLGLDDEFSLERKHRPYLSQYQPRSDS